MDLLGSLSAVLILFILLCSSLIVNVLQLISLCLPIPKRIRIVFCQRIANSWWSLLEFMFEIWSGTRFVFTGDALGRAESAIMIGNHSGGVDFMPGVCISARAEIGCGRMISLMKKVLQFMPGPGFMNFMTGSLFLSRSWESDLPKLDSMLAAVAGPNYPKPFFVGLFPEGTRITDKKREESWDFAEKNSLPRLHNVLLPRTKGFSHIADACRPVVDCVYDTTIAYEGGPAFIRHAIMEGAFRTQTVHVHIRRTEIKDLPTGQENLKQWLLSEFEMKDRLLEHFRLHNCFPGNRIYRPPATQRLINIFFIWAMVCLSVLSWFAPKWVWVPSWILAYTIVLRSFTNASNILQAARVDRDYSDQSGPLAVAPGKSNAPSIKSSDAPTSSDSISRRKSKKAD